VIRHILVWFFTTLSKASVVYGPLATAVVAMFSMEIAATLLLFGAQLIAEYECLGRERAAAVATVATAG
jgi:membrane protein